MKAVSFLAILPVAASSDTSWQWVPIAGTQCMNGEETGVWVRKSSSGGKNLGVYLNGGGACFNAVTCLTATTGAKGGRPGSSGIFDSRSDNPLADYNWMSVPYCTGDVHAGDITKSFEGATRHFAGSANLKLIMKYATETFQDVRTLFITGESAGGFGATASYVTMRDFYPNARGVLMDDSGPIMDDTAIPVCLQEKWRQTWNLNKNLPADCPCNNDQGDLVAAWSYGAKKYPKDSFSLISSQNDAVISTFFAYSNDDCKAVLPVGYTKLHAGLERLAQTTPVYMIPGAGHTHTSSSEFFSRVVDGQVLYKWIGQLIDPNQPDPKSVQPTAMDILNEVTHQRATNISVIV